MTKRSWVRALAVVVVTGEALLTVSMVGCAPDAPQQAVATTSPQVADVESDPIICWWKTDKNAVHVGERFLVTLTCRILETNRATIVVDLKQLEPTAVELSPFEVLDGAHPDDLRVGQWRFFQYAYTLRLLDEDVFGQDVEIPSVKVAYHRQSAQDDAALQGREQTYLLPAQPIRLLSLVPKSAGDIRDASRESFADIERRRFRANAELIGAAIFFTFAAVMLVIAGVRAVGRQRGRTSDVGPVVPVGAVLRGCLREAEQLRSDATREGWTPDLAGRALTVFRIGGAIALSRPVTQTEVPFDVTAREGQLGLSTGHFRRRRTLVSASTTAETVAKPISDGNGRAPASSIPLVAGLPGEEVLGDINDAIRMFNAACYDGNGQLDSATLDRGLERASEALSRLHSRTRWPARIAAAVGASAAEVRGAIWRR